MAIHQEEVQLRLGVDSRSIAPALNGVLGQVRAFAKNAGDSIKSMWRGLAFTGGVSAFKSVMDQFKELKDKPEEFQKVFGNLTSAQNEAFENLDKNLGGWKSKFVSEALGTTQALFNIFSDMLINKKTWSQAYQAQLDEDIAKIREFKQAVAEAAEDSKWQKEKTALLAFKAFAEGIDFKRMKPGDQLSFLDAKIAEENALAERAGQEGNEAKKYGHAANVLKFEDQRRTLVSKIESDRDAAMAAYTEAVKTEQPGKLNPMQAASAAANKRMMEMRSPLGGTDALLLGGPQFHKQLQSAVQGALESGVVLDVRIKAVEE